MIEGIMFDKICTDISVCGMGGLSMVMSRCTNWMI